MLKKYSKSSSFYLSGKASYFESNAQLLKEELARNSLYTRQPVRSLCKMCRAGLPGAIDFTSHNVGYKFCASCGHLNGNHEETDEFIQGVYLDEAAASYTQDYLDENFSGRTKNIYVPKAEFLLEGLGHKDFTLLDVGCGSGYFVHACDLLGVSATGIDVSEDMVNFGNRQILAMTGRAPLEHTAVEAFYDRVLNTDCRVVSAIGVIEHLKDPHDLIAAFNKSKAEYLYYSVPMFSTAVALENVFKNVYPRQLSGGHTHLFTESSIEKMHTMFGLTPVAQWRFGTDMMDLYRSLMVELSANGASDALVSRIEAGLGASLDGLQGVLDSNHFCSEIHCLAGK